MSDAHKRNLAVPFFTQRDNTYIWQQKNEITNIAFGPKYPMAWRSCNITSLCMILHYWGLTQETPNQMIERVYANQDWKWSTLSNGHEVLENWKNLRIIAEHYVSKHIIENENLIYKIIGGEQDDDFTMDFLKSQIEKGFPVMLSTGLASLIDDTNTYKGDGHIVVVRGFTVDGDVILNDPFGIPVDNDNKIKPLQGISENSSVIAGWYYNSQAASIGDNIVIKQSEFNKICKGTGKRYLCIEGPLWQEPGGTETDISNSYPIRSDNMWHDGIHLESAEGFHSIGAGRLVAARNAEVEGHGSSSFVLVKHHLPGEQIKPFYGLYMHLEKIDIKQELEDFFLKNNGTVSSKLKNTWYEQIFNNLLPRFEISYYSEQKLTEDGQQEDIYEAQIVNKKLQVKKENGKPVMARLDCSNKTGIESRHMKYYLLPPEKLEVLSNIENYKNARKLSFMIETAETDFLKDGYYFFFCGNGVDRKLCCAKQSKLDEKTDYRKYNEASYKYYVDCLYNLHQGNTVIFRRIDTRTKAEKAKRLKFHSIIWNPILSYWPNFCEDTKFLLRLQDTRSSSFVYLEDGYELIRNEITRIIQAGKSASQGELEKLIKDYKDNVEKLLKDLLAEISSKIENKQVNYGIIEKKSDKEWMKELFEDAERRLDCTDKMGRASEYNVDDNMSTMRDTFERMIKEYQNVSIIDATAMCIFLMLEFAGIPKERLTGPEFRFPFKGLASGNTYRMLNKLWKGFLDNHRSFFQRRYVDNYIEVPKGARIGYGSRIPDSGRKDSIHFEIFSGENLLPEESLVEDSDDDHFYDPSKITESIVRGLPLSEREIDEYLEYAQDNVITKEEIVRLYTETEHLRRLVTRHRSEWSCRRYTDDEIAKIVDTPNWFKKRLNKKNMVTALEYYNEYYNKYNWLDGRMKKELGTDRFFYYHPLHFLERLDAMARGEPAPTVSMEERETTPKFSNEEVEQKAADLAEKYQEKKHASAYYDTAAFARTLKSNSAFLDFETQEYVDSLAVKQLENLQNEVLVISNVKSSDVMLAVKELGLQFDPTQGDAFSIAGRVFVLNKDISPSDTSDIYLLKHEIIHYIQAQSMGGPGNFLTDYERQFKDNISSGMLDIDAYYSITYEKGAYSFGPSNNASKSYYKEKERMGDGFIE